MSTITLPSGLVGEVRGLTGKDGRYLTNEQLVRDNEIEDYIFSHCWTATVDDGPYKFDGKPPDWGRVLMGDRFAMLIAVREETYPGKEYVVKLQCGRTGCKKSFEWEIHLAELLAKKTKRLAPEDRAVFQDGNRFESVIPFTTTKFFFQLQTGANAKRVQARIEAKKHGPKKAQERQNRLVDVVAGLIVEIDGVPKKADAVFDFLEELSLGSIDALLPLMQSHDCGVETDIDIECTHCGGAMEISLPFDRAFFTPLSAAAKRVISNEDEEEEANESNGMKSATA
jgi:hypothetical protein